VFGLSWNLPNLTAQPACRSTDRRVAMGGFVEVVITPDLKVKRGRQAMNTLDVALLKCELIALNPLDQIRFSPEPKKKAEAKVSLCFAIICLRAGPLPLKDPSIVLRYPALMQERIGRCSSTNRGSRQSFGTICW
jgi:hypothetical protein